jgi:hypothetical protein
MKFRFIGGLALLVAAAAVLVAYPKWFLAPPTEIVTGYVGGSKANLLDNQKVKDILRERYQLEVKYSTLGGRESVSAITDSYDFLWPGTDLAVEDYKASHGGKAKYDSILLSPIVMYTWEPVARRLTEAGLVARRADGTYYANMSSFVPALLEERIQPPEGQTGGNPVAVFTSDPTQSNSGQVFAALLAQILQDQNGGTFEQAFPLVKAYIDNLGFKPPRTSDLFKQCIGKGMGACPIFVAYESLLPDFVEENHIACTELEPLKAIYPEPTIWATHPLIAATPGGEKLLLALQDPEIQKIAAEAHGFRSILGKAPPNTCIKSAETVSAMPLPTKPEMDQLTAYLSQQP